MEQEQAWTQDRGRCNTSEEFRFLSEKVARLIRDSAFDLIEGRVDAVGHLIMANLAHKYGLQPVGVKLKAQMKNRR